MDIFNEKQALSAEEMEALKGGGYWIEIDGEWHWVEDYSIDPPEKED